MFVHERGVDGPQCPRESATAGPHLVASLMVGTSIPFTCGITSGVGWPSRNFQASYRAQTGFAGAPTPSAAPRGFGYRIQTAIRHLALFVDESAGHNAQYLHGRPLVNNINATIPTHRRHV